MLSVISKENIYHSVFLLFCVSLSLEVEWHIVGFAGNAQWLVDHKAGPSRQASDQTPAAKQVTKQVTRQFEMI